MKKTKFALLQSVVALILCVTMLIGSTFAWFTDSVTSGINQIFAGTLDVELEYRTQSGNWITVDEGTNIFDENAKWEPGHTEVVYLRISNEGSLALKYQLGINIVSETPSVNVNGDPFRLSQFIRFGAVADQEEKFTSRNAAMEALTTTKLISKGYSTQNALQAQDEQYMALVVYMPESVGNDANYATGEAIPSIQLGLSLVATQYTSESDSFDNNYDSQSQFPVLNLPDSLRAVAEVDADNKVAQALTMASDDNALIAQIPTGVLMDEDMDTLLLTVREMATSGANITLEENEIQRSLDVHIAGVSPDNTVPMQITVAEAMMPGLNIGNYKLYHMDKGVKVQMTSAATLAELDAHNEFYYDPATGDMTLSLATFSEVALVADTENKWNGTYAENFASGTGTETDPYLIANADQLAYLGEVISNENDAYADKHYKLIFDINLGGEENANKGNLFYPIGYHKVGGTIATIDVDDAPEFLYFDEDPDYARSNVNAVAEGESTEWYTYGGAFKGTFDGDGHKISNIYQNTWQLKGNYDGNYWNAAMGLFGYVYGGTVKNLTVENFQSDGEFTPTGVIAAYAAASSSKDAVFGNIAIVNCNPRVYNTGNGGIVGIGGNSSDTSDKKMFFTNITVDNTNKISALWGSWDVACGGLMGMFRGRSLVHFENCHVGAQIDVFNDVCGNYQYYWYRYSGMVIGSLRGRNTTDAKGYTVPDMSGITAKNCTVHFGEWNNYYYCELVANSLASYTHDHQFSRLTQIQNVSEIQDANGNWNTTGNFILMNGKTPTATCYHIVKDANGNLTEHKHEDAGTETVNGQTVLKENNQRVFLPFNQLFQGDGWGVKHVPVYNGENYAFSGITILDRVSANSVTKFEGKVNQLMSGSAINIGDIFSSVESGVDIVNGSVTVTVTNLDENNPVSAVFTRDSNNIWENGTLMLNGSGRVLITIQDYYFCTPTTIEVNVVSRQPEVKFLNKFTGDFLYRVGNAAGSTVSLGTMFLEGDNYPIVDSSVAVSIETVTGNATGSFTQNASDWTKGTIQFSGTGIVKVTITDSDYCTPTVLSLEVVDAVNATGATSATSNNVVLLTDCGFSSIDVTNGYTLFGNGFTMTCDSDSAALDMGYAFVNLTNGTLDNVQIVTPNFDHAVLYKSNMTDAGNRSETTDKTRYYNVKSGVMVSGNSQILNSRISGARAAVNIAGGNCLIDNSRIEGGAVASVLIGAANSVTLRDITLVQKPTASTYNPSKTLMGFSVLFICDESGNATPVTVEGKLVQNAWVDESKKSYIPSGGESLISAVMGKTNFLHDLNNDNTKESLNLGFAYMPEALGKSVNKPTVNDNRTDKGTIPYSLESISTPLGTPYVFSYTNANGTADNFKSTADYTPNKQGDIIAVGYSDTNEHRILGKVFGEGGWVYQLSVDLDQGAYTFDFSKLTVQKNGVTLGINRSDKVAVEEGTTTYTLTLSDSSTITFKLIGTATTKDAPQWSSDKNGSALSTSMNASWEAGVCVASKKGGTWHGAAPALQNVYIRYYSTEAKAYKVIHLADYTPNVTGKVNGSNTTCTITGPDFTLTLTGGQVHSSNNVYAIPVVCAGKLYFLPATSSGLVNSGNSARTVPVSYSFTDGFGNTLTGSHTWSVSEDKNNEKDYSKFCEGTMTAASSGSSTCIAEGSMITMADGSKKAVEDIRRGDLVMAFDHVTGKVVYKEVALVGKTYAECYYKSVFVFNDGTELDAINEHGIYDLDLNQYVNIGHENYQDYIGHRFVSVDSAGNIGVKYLVDVISSIESGYKYDIVTNETLTYVVEDTLSVSHEIVMIMNSFAFGADMTYDADAMQADIEKYGLYTYEDFAAYCDRATFEKYSMAMMKVGAGKGMYTYEHIVYLLTEIALNDSVQII